MLWPCWTMVAHTFNPSTWKAESGTSLWVQGQPGKQSEFQDSQDCYTETSRLEKPNIYMLWFIIHIIFLYLEVDWVLLCFLFCCCLFCFSLIWDGLLLCYPDLFGTPEQFSCLSLLCNWYCGCCTSMSICLILVWFSDRVSLCRLG